MVEFSIILSTIEHFKLSYLVNVTKFLTVSGANSGSKENSILPKFVSIIALVNIVQKINYHKNLLSNKLIHNIKIKKIIIYL